MSNDANQQPSDSHDLIRELDKLIIHVRDAVRECDQLAAKGNSQAYETLSMLVQEIESLVTRTPSRNVLDFRSELGSWVSGLSVLALANCDRSQLLQYVATARAQIELWRPAAPQSDEKPELVFGDSSEVRSAWEAEALAESKRVASQEESRRRIADSVRPIIESLDSLRRNLAPDIERHDYSISRQPSGSYIVRFGGELGFLTGEQARRFVQFVRHRRIGVEALITDQLQTAASRSVMSQHDGSEINHASGQSIAQTLGRTNARNLRQALNHQLEDIQLRLHENLSSDERERLETRRDLIETYRGGIWRIPDGQIRKYRTTIQQGWNRVATSLELDMPNFANHIRDCWRYDARVDEYVYEGVDWHFDGF